MCRLLTFAACLLFVTSLTADDWPVVIEDDFDSGLLSRWRAADPAAWKFEEVDGRKTLSQFQQSQVQTPVRCPFNRAVASGVIVGDFQLDVDLQSTARDYAHRSLCLFFGYRDPAHHYYVHLGQKTDDHANQIFIVNEAPRVKISTKTTAGTPWDNAWHHVRIRRIATSGLIEIYFDDMQSPAMTATDRTFLDGEIGLGSFDDTGRFDNLVVRGLTVSAKPAP